MIRVVFTRTEGGDVLVEANGHASAGTEKEDVQVCAAVSALLRTLWDVAARPGVEHRGENGGYLRLQVPPQREPLLLFAQRGLELIRDGYPGTIEIDTARY